MYMYLLAPFLPSLATMMFYPLDQFLEELSYILFPSNYKNIKYQHAQTENVIKIENSLLVIFDKIWPMTLYYSTGYFVKFWSNFKNS